MLTRAALKNPYAVFALCMIALIFGGVSYQKMRVDIFPEIKLPSILVTTFYRGLSPSEMEGAITFRLEQRFVEASYVEHIESQSLAGMSYIKVFFQPEYGIDAAQSELTSLAYSVIRTLPPGVYPPSVFKFGVVQPSDRATLRRQRLAGREGDPRPGLLHCAPADRHPSPAFPSALRWAEKSGRSPSFSISSDCLRGASLHRMW